MADWEIDYYEPTSPFLTTGNTLKQGVTGGDVQKTQQLLNSLGYTVNSTGAGSNGSETEYYGTRTAAAVRQFQTANGLTPDGVVGRDTRAKLNDAYAKCVLNDIGCTYRK